MKKDLETSLKDINEVIDETKAERTLIENNFSNLIARTFRTDNLLSDDIKVKAEFRSSADSRRVYIGLAKDDELIFGTSTAIWIEYDPIKERTIFDFHPLGGIGSFDAELDLVKIDAIRLQAKVLENISMIKYFLVEDEIYNRTLIELKKLFEQRDLITKS